MRLRKIILIGSLFSLLSLNVYGRTEKVIFKFSNIDSKVVSEIYENQMDSSYLPEVSCVSTVGKMICNILCIEKTEDCYKSVGQISMDIGTSYSGAAISNLGYYMSNCMKNINYSMEYSKDNIVTEIANSILSGSIVAFVSEYSKVNKRDSRMIGKNYINNTNHCILITGIEIDLLGNYIFEVLDPAYKDETMYLSANDIINSTADYLYHTFKYVETKE